jgi:hypothetical protein
MADERRSQGAFSVLGVIVLPSAWCAVSQLPTSIAAEVFVGNSKTEHWRRETDMNEVVRSGLLLVVGLGVTAAGILVIFFG